MSKNGKSLIFDAHLDLAMNALEWNRDLTQPLETIRLLERGMTDRKDRGEGTVSLPAMREGGVQLCVATQIARFAPPGYPFPSWNSPEQAWAQTQGQLAWYRAMEEKGEMVAISNGRDLDEFLQNLHERREEKNPIGYVLSLEGADSILSPEHLFRAFENGLRAVGPAHYGPGLYAGGTGAREGLNPRGRELLKAMEELGIILDATHLCDKSFEEALDCFEGAIWASHSNCRALVPHDRQLKDEQIKLLLDRDAVIGSVFDAWMLAPGWTRGETTPRERNLKMEAAVDHIDHICQLAGNAAHAGVGSDLDGGFGREQTPLDLSSIARLDKIPGLLGKRGYGEEDIAGIMQGNFIRFLRNHWGSR